MISIRMWVTNVWRYYCLCLQDKLLTFEFCGQWCNHHTVVAKTTDSCGRQRLLYSINWTWAVVKKRMLWEMPNYLCNYSSIFVANNGRLLLLYVDINSYRGEYKIQQSTHRINILSCVGLISHDRTFQSVLVKC